jgi:hypothetical protein
MRMNRLVAAAAITFGLSSVAYATEPVAPTLDEMAGQSSIIQVQPDCHRDTVRHYLPEFDRRVWHHHGRHCRIILDEDVRRFDREDDPMRRYGHRRRDEGCVLMGSPPLTFEYCP